MMDNNAQRKWRFRDWLSLILVVGTVAGIALGIHALLTPAFPTALAQSEVGRETHDARESAGGDTSALPSDSFHAPENEAQETASPGTPPDTASQVPAEDAPQPTAEETQPPTEPAPPADTAPPVIEGAADKSVVVGDTVSYREGVTVSDDSGGPVELEIDSSKVDLLTPGSYPLTYTARDGSGNETTVTVTVTVTQPPKTPSTSGGSSKTKKPWEATEEDVYALAQKVLDKILEDGMTQREKAYAIFKYVHKNISYVGASDKSSWIAGAYVGFTQKRGDCFTYFACSKALLTLAGIPNVDLERVGGTTRHYWQLVDVGEGYMHFDACPHSHTNTVTFLLTETEARAFTEAIAWYRPNYYVYDYASCPVPVVGLDESERNPQPEVPPETEPEVPPETQPEVPPEAEPGLPPETQPELPPETQPEVSPETEPAEE